MIYIVTGVSGGLGEAITQKLLARGETVIGLGRNNYLKSETYTFLPCDLSLTQNWEDFFPDELDDELTLINNAGIIEPISRMADINDDRVVDHIFKVNTIAPLKLAMHLYRKMTDKSSFSLVNISSGAADKSIPSWGLYCASKSALNRWTETFKLEEWERGKQPKVYAIAPGVVDTPMQEKIRSVSEELFSRVGHFQKLKNEKQLFSPVEAAELVLNLIQRPYTGQVFYDIREITD